jgi:hypothetical protein
MSTQREIELAALAYRAYSISNPNLVPTLNWTRDNDLSRSDKVRSAISSASSTACWLISSVSPAVRATVA